MSRREAPSRRPGSSAARAASLPPGHSGVRRRPATGRRPASRPPGGAEPGRADPERRHSADRSNRDVRCAQLLQQRRRVGTVRLLEPIRVARPRRNRHQPARPHDARRAAGQCRPRGPRVVPACAAVEKGLDRLPVAPCVCRCRVQRRMAVVVLRLDLRAALQHQLDRFPGVPPEHVQRRFAAVVPAFSLSPSNGHEASSSTPRDDQLDCSPTLQPTAPAPSPHRRPLCIR